jgi:hypothetical protein
MEPPAAQQQQPPEVTVLCRDGQQAVPRVSLVKASMFAQAFLGGPWQSDDRIDLREYAKSDVARFIAIMDGPDSAANARHVVRAELTRGTLTPVLALMGYLAATPEFIEAFGQVIRRASDPRAIFPVASAAHADDQKHRTWRSPPTAVPAAVAALNMVTMARPASSPSSRASLLKCRRPRCVHAARIMESFSGEFQWKVETRPTKVKCMSC